jgi:hypothetical protein
VSSINTTTLYSSSTKPAILQRVLSASVTVDKQLISSIGQGILVLAAVGPDDTKKDAESMAAKVLKMKLWPDEVGNGVCPPPVCLQPLPTIHSGSVVFKTSRVRFYVV